MITINEDDVIIDKNKLFLQTLPPSPTSCFNLQGAG